MALHVVPFFSNNCDELCADRAMMTPNIFYRLVRKQRVDDVRGREHTALLHDGLRFFPVALLNWMVH